MTTRILRLLLLAALAWPTWTPATAQENTNNTAPAGVPSIVSESGAFSSPKRSDKKTSKKGKAIKFNNPKSTSKSIKRENRSTYLHSSSNYNSLRNKTKAISPKADKVTITPPSDATIEEWNISTTWERYEGEESGWVSYNFTPTVKVAIYNNDFYIAGLCVYLTDSWVKGTLNGNTVTFPTGQYYGAATSSDGTSVDLWFVGQSYSDEIADVVFTYDEENQSLTLGQFLILDAASPDDLSCYSLQQETTISKPFSEDDVFEKGTYKWPINSTNQQTSKLSDIATDPDQIIAMLREIYMNKSIPGSWKRGYTTTGADEDYNAVNYGGVGTISWSNTISYEDDYGWGIPGTIKSGTYGNYQYLYMDPEQYKPNKEGLTLMLVELKDDFNYQTYTNTTETEPYAKLRSYVQNAIKSVRVVRESKRTGTGFDAGTLFKVDCDKMNKFFFMAKGQMRWLHHSYFEAYSNTFCDAPCYIYNRYRNIDSFYDELSHPIFYNMFEEFSPSEFDVQVPTSDVYQELVNMKSYNIKHDCEGVAYIGHQFMMYGDDSDAADCQDVRDMMFFIPDYRMMKWSNRDENNYQKFLRYNQNHLPSIALYVIRQDPVTETTAFKEEDNYYHLTLTWDSNLDEFLPSNQQEYQLYEVKTDPVTGEVSYVPVYYTTVDANGNVVYADANGQALAEGADPIEVTLTVDPSNGKKTFVDVYVQREAAGKIVTYAIRGQDKDHFLSLQMSNEQSYIIKGLDPGEMVLLQDATHYSRFDAQNVRNCYSNKLMLKNNPNGIKPAYLAVGTKLTISRQTAANVDPTDVAVIEVTEASATGGKMSITLYNQDDETMFPIGAKTGAGTGKHAGYHHNTLNDITYTVNANGDVDFGTIVLFDNFVVDVSQNNHPSQYIYKVNFTTATAFEGINGENRTDAYSNAFRIRIFKTNSKINNEYSLINVKSDKTRSIVLDENTKFSALTQYNSKTEVLRYDAYRWNAQEARTIITSVNGEDNEVDIAPTGIAGNQGEYYTVTMNDEDTPDYYVGHPVYVSTTGHAWADFVDVIPTKEESGVAAYVYAPVAESFTFGKDVNNKVRKDYNTYGGPLQTAAIGKLEIVPAGYEISRFSWLKGEGENAERYAYYNVELKVEKDEIPQGYEIYMIRAWRQIDEQYLDEYEPLFLNRKSSDYLFEEMLGAQEEGGEYQQGQKMLLGSTQVTSVIGEDDQPVAISDLVYRGTFGARKVVTSTAGHEDANDHCIDKLEMNFIVRIYFTPKTSTNSPAPGMSIQPKSVDNNSKFYVAEYTVPYTITGGISTGIESVQARQVAGVKYYNVAGVESDRPFKGVNIVVTRYSDGSMSTTKIVK